MAAMCMSRRPAIRQMIPFVRGEWVEPQLDGDFHARKAILRELFARLTRPEVKIAERENGRQFSSDCGPWP
jgi:hypothetical protein